MVGALDCLNVPVSAIVDEVIEGFSAECRLTGATIRAEAVDERGSVRLNAAEAVAGLSGALLATLALVEHAQNPIIVVSVGRSDSGALIVDVAQKDAPLSRRAAEHFFELEAQTDRPGGYAAAIGALAARTLAERHRGHASLEAIEGGSRLTMTLVP